MERLRTVIQSYSRWTDLEDYCSRIETYLLSNFAIAIENSKVLLESICKTILTEQNEPFSTNDSVQKLMKATISVLNIPQHSEQVRQFGTSFVNMVQNLAEVRNTISVVSHGQPLDTLRQQRIDEISANFLVSSTETVACILIEFYEIEHPRAAAQREELYGDHPDFDTYLDDKYGDVMIVKYAYPSSEAFFAIDKTAYLDELQQFQGGHDATD